MTLNQVLANEARRGAHARVVRDHAELAALWLHTLWARARHVGEPVQAGVYAAKLLRLQRQWGDTLPTDPARDWYDEMEFVWRRVN